MREQGGSRVAGREQSSREGAGEQGGREHGEQGRSRGSKEGAGREQGNKTLTLQSSCPSYTACSGNHLTRPEKYNISKIIKMNLYS